MVFYEFIIQDTGGLSGHNSEVEDFMYIFKDFLICDEADTIFFFVFIGKERKKERK